MRLKAFFVVLEGFEPSQAEPESDVLPLHHKTASFCFCGAKLSFYFETAKQKSTFLDFLLHFFYKLIISSPQIISNLHNFNRLASFDTQSTYYFFKTVIITEIGYIYYTF